MDKDRQSMPAIKQIRDYWFSEEGIELLRKKTGLILASKAGCMTCGTLGYVECCHIVAKVNGGSYNESNLHLLCKNCHIESEYFEDERYWRWFRNKYIRDYKEPFQRIEEKLNLQDLSMRELYKLHFLGKTDVALQMISEYVDEWTRDYIKRLFGNQENKLSEEDAEKLANQMFETFNQRIFSMNDDDWVGETEKKNDSH